LELQQKAIKDREEHIVNLERDMFERYFLFLKIGKENEMQERGGKAYFTRKRRGMGEKDGKKA
jgi:hypothetical protein